MSLVPLTQIRVLDEVRRRPAPDVDAPQDAERTATVPRLVDGVEPLGRFASTGLWEPPHLVRRADGQLVAVSALLHHVVASIDGTRDSAEIAELVSAHLGRRLTAGQVEYLLDRKLDALGVLEGASAGASAGALARPDPLLGLKFRVGVVPAGAVGVIGGLLAPLFYPAIVALAVISLVALDVWLVVSHAIGRELVASLLLQPTLMLALLAISWVSVAFHECGHAAATRYGGMMPGRIGVGLYIVWPVFFTDVTEAYRLGRRARLRIDLGGIYFNVIFAVGLAGTYFATGFAPLLLAILAQQFAIISQLMPWLRLDGYWIVSDLVGVTDLFARVRPALLSLLPGQAQPGMQDLKPWARRVVGVWVVTAILVGVCVSVAMVYAIPRIGPLVWSALHLQLDLLSPALERGELLIALSAGAGTAMLTLPWIALSLTLLRALWLVPTTVWLRLLSDAELEVETMRPHAAAPAAPALVLGAGAEPAFAPPAAALAEPPSGRLVDVLRRRAGQSWTGWVWDSELEPLLDPSKPDRVRLEALRADGLVDWEHTSTLASFRVHPDAALALAGS